MAHKAWHEDRWAGGGWGFSAGLGAARFCFGPGFAWGLTAARDEAPDLAVDAFAVCFASVSGFAVGLDDAGFTFFRGPGSPFFCLVSLAMQSRSVLSPRAAAGRRHPWSRLKQGRFRRKGSRRVLKRQDPRISVERPNPHASPPTSDTSSVWALGTCVREA